MADKKKKVEPKKETKHEMFEHFGECDSAEEMNLAVDGWYEEGDIDSIKAFAKENGFEDRYVESYIELRKGNPNELFTNDIEAAIAKLGLEKEENSQLGIFADDIIDYLASECIDEKLAKGIRKKGKRLSEAAGLIVKESKKNSISIPDGGRCNYCGPMKGFSLIRNYYTED